jgi:acyl-ACP thioesterase
MRFRVPFQVRFYETDRSANLTPVALFNYLQEAAVRHGDEVSMDGHVLADLGYVWMMNRLHIRVDRYPGRREEVSVETWGSRFKGMFATREWRVNDAQDHTVAVATGRWVLLGGEPKRIIRIPPLVSERYGEYADRALEDPFARMDAPAEFDCRRRFHVRYSELDTNQHANSASYVDWCLEAVPIEVLETYIPASIEITFKKECRLGEELEARSEELPEASPASRRFRHALWRLSDDALLAVAASEWRPAT